MPTRQELMKISRTRLKEVKVLYKNGLYDGARYVSGYVVETALKARICKILDSNYPDTGDISRAFFTHKFDSLLKLSGLQRVFEQELNANVAFKTNWSLLTGWTETLRYSPIGVTSKNDVEDIINALEDKTDGILTWIMKRW